MPADPPSNGPRMSMGLLFIGSEMVSFTLLGLLFDYVLGSLPVLTIAMTLLGLGAAFFHMIKMSKKLARKPPNPPVGPGTDRDTDSLV
jgi:F0F1-type ATP synthase assembly protein I